MSAPEQTSTYGHDMLAPRVSTSAVPQDVSVYLVAQVGVNNARPTTANYRRAPTHNICEHAKRRRTRQFDSFHDRRRPLPISRIRLLATPAEAPRRETMVSRANDTITPTQSASRCCVTLSPKCKRRRNVGET